MNLLEALTAEMQTEASARPVFEAIELGLAPFRAGKIVSYISSWEGWQDTLCFEVGKLPYLPFKISIDRHQLDLESPQETYLRIAQAAFKFYRYRSATPVDDHIILGED
jgi:hypothetical protein